MTKYYHTSIVQLVEDQLIVLLGNYRYNEQEVALSENFLGSSQFVMEIESLAVLSPFEKHDRRSKKLSIDQQLKGRTFDPVYR